MKAWLTRSSKRKCKGRIHLHLPNIYFFSDFDREEPKQLKDEGYWYSQYDFELDEQYVREWGIDPKLIKWNGKPLEVEITVKVKNKE